MKNRKAQIGDLTIQLITGFMVDGPTVYVVDCFKQETDESVETTPYATEEEAVKAYETKVKEEMKKYEESIQNTPRRSATIT